MSKRLIWKPLSTWTTRKKAEQAARAVRAQGEHSFPSRVVRVVFWRVEYGEPPIGQGETK